MRSFGAARLSRTKLARVVTFSFATRAAGCKADPSPVAPTDLLGEPEREQVLQPVTDGVGGKVGAAAGHANEDVSRVG